MRPTLLAAWHRVFPDAGDECGSYPPHKCCPSTVVEPVATGGKSVEVAVGLEPELDLEGSLVVCLTHLAPAPCSVERLLSLVQLDDSLQLSWLYLRLASQRCCALVYLSQLPSDFVVGFLR